mmetsp:Transcript_52702/g.63519  ORF Transcript_52702/g.63519 Transcript_52702/m.63519 type:complete len:675 (+) Transcript_52702:114-2138(+)
MSRQTRKKRPLPGKGTAIICFIGSSDDNESSGSEDESLYREDESDDSENSDDETVHYHDDKSDELRKKNNRNKHIVSSNKLSLSNYRFKRDFAQRCQESNDEESDLPGEIDSEKISEKHFNDSDISSDDSMNDDPFSFQRRKFVSRNSKKCIKNKKNAHKRKKDRLSHSDTCTSSSDDDCNLGKYRISSSSDDKSLSSGVVSYVISSSASSNSGSFKFSSRRKQTIPTKKNCRNIQNHSIDVLSCSDSSDEEEIDTRMIDKSTSETLRKAREARKKLSEVQVSKVVNIDEKGSILNIRLHVKASSVCKIADVGSETFQIRSKEPLKRLMKYVCKLHPDVSESHIMMAFDGKKILIDRTPEFCGMKDGDLIDITLKPSSFPVAVTGAQYKEGNVSTNRIVVRTEIRNGLENPNLRVWQIRETDELQKIVDAYCQEEKISNSKVVLRNGATLINLRNTPLVEGLSDGVLLRMDVNEGLQLSTTAAKAASPGRLKLVLRVNGDKENLQPYTVHPSDKFETLINSFRRRNSKNSGNSSGGSYLFILDGEKLNPFSTCIDEDLEGGEMIDVTFKETVSASQSAENVSKRNFGSLEDITPISIQTIRNKCKTRPKKFKLRKCDTLDTLRKEYIAYYRSKGCRKVRFYLRHKLLEKCNDSLESLGLIDMDKLDAIENDRAF